MLTQTPQGLNEIIRTFGNSASGNFESQNIVLFDLPYPLYFDEQVTNHARCHKLLVANFQQAFNEILKAGLDSEAKNYGGVYQQRNIRLDAAHRSTHSWGIAIDLEPQKYPLGSLKRFPQGIIDAFHRAGFFYGGDFKGRKDPMHFQFASGY